MATIEELQAQIEKLRDQQATTRRSTRAEQETVLAELRASYPKATDGLEVYAPQGRDLAAELTAIEGELTSVADAEMDAAFGRSAFVQKAARLVRDPRSLTMAQLEAASAEERAAMAREYGHLLSSSDLASFPREMVSALADAELARKMEKIT